MKFNKFLLNTALISIMIISATALAATSQELSVEGKKNLRSGNMHLAGGRFEKALPLFEGVLEENPHSIDALQNIAAIYYDSKKQYFTAHDLYSKAISEIEGLLVEFDEMMKTDEKAAKKFYKKEIKKPKYDKALENMIKLKRSCWIKIFNNGQNLYKAKAYDEALKEYDALLEIAPDSIKTYKMLAIIHGEMENSDKSIEIYKKLSDMEPSEIAPIQKVASQLFNVGNFEEAADWYIKATIIEADNPDNYFNAAICYTNAKNTEKAYEYFVLTSEKDPTNLDALLNASNNAAVLGDTENQIKYLKLSIELDKENVANISYLCSQLVAQKKYAEALPYAKMWNTLEPENETVQQILSFLKQQK